jgi:hypothetical protein
MAAVSDRSVAVAFPATSTGSSLLRRAPTPGRGWTFDEDVADARRPAPRLLGSQSSLRGDGFPLEDQR